MGLLARVFRKDNFKTNFEEIKVVISEVKKEYKMSRITDAILEELKYITDYFDKNSLVLGRKLLEMSKRINMLLKSVATSFAKIVNDPTFDEELKGAKLNLRQLNAYKNVLKGNQEGLESLQKMIKGETIAVRGTYASLRSLKQELERLKDRTERAKKADLKLHKSLPKVDRLMTELAKKLYPGGQ
jgi:hypothetical protein